MDAVTDIINISYIFQGTSLTITLELQMHRLTKLLNHNSVRLARTKFIFGLELT